MKLLFLFQLSFLFVASSCFSQEEKIADAQQKYIKQFQEAVMSHSEKKVFKLLDKAYRKEQLKFLQGNRTQLVDEMFGGSDMETNDFRNIKLANILKIEVAEVIHEKNGMFKYIFRIKTSDFEIFTSLSLNKKGKKYGFTGAFG
ncbi:MAG: hypothetical protein COA33_010750 [Fluviicola sp.]|nr:hypothetical protein [Fluviicola sp.]